MAENWHFLNGFVHRARSMNGFRAGLYSARAACTPFYTNSIPPSTTAGGLRAPPAHLIFPMKTAPAQAAVPAACPKSTFLASFAYPGESSMSGKDRRKYHGTHRIYQRPRNWARVFREGWLEEDRPTLRRQRALLRATR